MKNITKCNDGGMTMLLHLKPDEKRQLKKLSKYCGKNDFDTIKYAVQLVSWWSHNQIEPDDSEGLSDYESNCERTR